MKKFVTFVRVSLFLGALLFFPSCDIIPASDDTDHPDLKIEAFTISPESPHTRDSITFQIVVKNNGAERSSETVVEVRAGGESAPPQYDVPALDPDEEHEVSRKIRLPLALTYLAIARVDPGNEIEESSEINNIDSLIFRVNPPPRPDLIIDSISFRPTSPSTRDSITFSIRVQNRGPGISSACQLEFKVGGESSPPQYFVPSLGAEATYTRERKMLLPIALTYLAIAKIDAGSDIIEVREDNNLDSLIFSVNPPPRPDLVIDTISYSPASPTTRDSITFSIRVQNRGPGFSSACQLEFKVGGESSPPQYFVPSLGAGATYTRERKMLLPIALTYLAIAKIDAGSDIIEVREDNNLDSLIFSVNPPPRPDLVIDTISYSPASPTTRDSITFSIRVQNRGPGFSSACQLEFKVGGESSPPQYFVPSLGAGATYTRERKMLLPIALTYLAIAKIDAGNDIIEVREDNNLDSLIFSVNPPPRPDLIVDTISYSPASPTTRDSITFSIRVQNRGPGFSSACQLEFKVGGESTPPHYFVPSLGAGATYTRERKMLLPIALTYLAIAKIDAGNDITEVREDNNLDSLIFSVTPPPRPDMEIASFTKSPASPTTEDSITFSVQVRNNGPGTSSMCYLEIKIGGEATPPLWPVPAMASSATVTVAPKMLLPVASTYLGIATIDATNTLIEGDETNNKDSLNFTVDPPPAPDLSIYQIRHSPSTPLETDSITLTVTVRNEGAGKAAPCNLTLRLDGEAAPPMYAIPLLVSGASSDITRKILVAAGSHTATALADATNLVVESDETNNRHSHIFTVSGIDLGPLAYYSFSNDVEDDSGNDRHGEAHGGSFAPDKEANPNSAYQFGGGDHISIADVPIEMSGNPSWSVVFWINPESSEVSRCILALGDTVNNQALIVGINSEGYYEAGYWGALKTFTYGVTEDWTFISFTFNSSTKELKVYYAGMLHQTIDAGDLQPDIDPKLFTLGKLPGNNTSFFPGKLDEVRLYDRVLESSELTDLMSSQAQSLK